MITTSDTHWEIRENVSLGPVYAKIEALTGLDYSPLITIEGSVAAWDECALVLSRMRAAGLPVLLKLKKGDWTCELEELNYLFRAMRGKDQLTLSNTLELFGGILNQETRDQTRDQLEVESRIELKSFQEWIVATCDPRLHKYPVLPWRSFIRKVIEENFEFANGALDILYMYGDDAEQSPELKNLIANFLESKKKVLCLFPKKWSRDQ